MSTAEALDVAIIQTELVWQDAAANRELLQPLLWQASGADLIILPETFNSGFSMQSQHIAETMQGATVQWLQQQAHQLGAVICGSMAVATDAGIYNRLLWVQPEGKIAYYDKRHLFRMAGEDLHYQPGQRRVIVEYKGFRLLLQVCYDLRFPVFSRNQNDYDAILYVANWPAARSRIWSTLLQARAIENQAYVLGCNRVGVDGNGHGYSGDSVILNYLGEPLAELPPGEAGVLRHRLDLPALQQFRRQFPAALDADAFSLTAE
ncbi:amidohydrolase [Rheinheimera texasensis]|uniref:amidohydrolase n=1 Tax=Rheinheimera texasensis TaxID=306205 RepID=UPI0004E20CAF|nr:amidohydrolase [Rheinheimera texasensis]